MLAKTFRFGPVGAHVGVVLYDSRSNVAISLNSGREVNSFIRQLEKIPYKARGRTRCLDQGLAAATSEIFSPEASKRGNTLKALVYLTDGPTCVSRHATPIHQVVRSLRERYVRVFAVGVGRAAPLWLLKRTTTSPKDIFQLDSFDDLGDIVSDLSAQMCEDL